MRKRAIQHRHEHAAARAEASVNQGAVSEWEQIAPVIDEAMSHLSTKDRDAVVLRYFEDQPFAQVGQVLRISESAARKRVGRALERLRGMLSRRGTTLGGATLGMMIAAHAVHASPVTMTISTTAASSGAFNIAKGAIQMMAWAKAKLIAFVVAAAFVVLTAGGVAILVLPQLHAQSAPAPQAPIGENPLKTSLAAPASNPTSAPADIPGIAAAKTDISNIETSIDAFEIDTGRYPTTEQGLNALLTAPLGVRKWNGPYFIHIPGDCNQPDPWGHPYRYLAPGVHNKRGYDLWSAGPDGIDGNEDDITNWAR